MINSTSLEQKKAFAVGMAESEPCIRVHLNNLKIDIIKKDSKMCLKCLISKMNPKTLDAYMIPLDAYMILIRRIYDSLDAYMIPLDAYMSLTARRIYESKRG